MARGPDGPVRWPRPGTVQQQWGQLSLKSILGHGYPKDIHISDMDILYSDMDILRGIYLCTSTSLGVHIYTNFTDMYTNGTISTCKLKKCDIWICMDFGWIYIDVSRNR